MGARRIGILVGLAALALPANASGAVINVTTTADVTASDGSCTLREAISVANSGIGTSDCPRTGTGAPTINVPANASHYSLAAGATGEDANASGDLDITNGVTIVGGGAASTIIDGAQHDRVFDVHPGATTELRNLTVTGGLTPTPA